MTAAMIPVIAILGACCIIIARMALRFEERKLQLRAGAPDRAIESIRTEFQQLRDDLARLRDTSTQYDVSIQHTLEDLQGRVAALESRREAGRAWANAEEESRPVPVGISGEQPAKARA